MTADAAPPVVDGSLPGEDVADTTVPERLDLGAVSCGTTATTSFELASRGPAPLRYSFISLPHDVEIVPSEGIIPAGAAQTVTVKARVPAQVAARTAFAGTATLISNARQGDALSIPITYRAQGATIVMPSQISFGDTPVQTAVSRTFTVRNDGDVAARLSVPVSSGEMSVQLGADAAVTVEPGASMTGEARYLPTNLGQDSDIPDIAIAGPTCGEQTVLTLLSGQGVPRSGVVVDAGPVDFGDATCGIAPPGQTITLTNPETNDATFTAEVVLNSSAQRPFHVSPTSGTVPAGRSVTLTVTSDVIAGPAQARVYTASLRVITRLDVSTAHAVPIRMNLAAAELSIAANAGDPDNSFAAMANLGFVPVGTTAVAPFSVVNTGNKVATLIPSAAAPFHIHAPATIAPGEFVDGTIEYTAVSPGPVTALSELVSGDACAPTITLELHAGVGSAASIEPATAAATRPAPATVSAPLRVTNNGNAPLRLTCEEHGTLGALQLAPSELTIPAGGTDAFTVTMVAGPDAAGVLRRDIRCSTNQWLHETRDTTMTLTVSGE